MVNCFVSLDVCLLDANEYHRERWNTYSTLPVIVQCNPPFIVWWNPPVILQCNPPVIVWCKHSFNWLRNLINSPGTINSSALSNTHAPVTTGYNGVEKISLIEWMILTLSLFKIYLKEEETGTPIHHTLLYATMFYKNSFCLNLRLQSY